MNKFDRVISILILLQSKKLLKAQMISVRFDISLRTVYRDIATLKNAGIPIIGDPGIGYSLLEGYRLPPVTFNEEEVAAMMTVDKFVDQITDEATQVLYSNALMKIKAILRHNEKSTADLLDESIASTPFIHQDSQSYLQDVLKSISNKKAMFLQYTKGDESYTERIIEPIGCYRSRSTWYVVAYCQLRHDYRTFKMNRIKSLQKLDQDFSQTHISLKKYMDMQDDSWKNEQSLIKFKIAFNHKFAQFAESRKYYFGFLEQTVDGDAVTMTFLNSSVEYMTRWLIQFGDQVKVLEPESLRVRLRELSQELYQHHK